MTLRTRLLSGYAALVVLLLLAAVGGSLGFREVSDVARTRLERYLATTEAADGLLRALESHLASVIDLFLDPASGDARVQVDEGTADIRAKLAIVERDEGDLAPSDATRIRVETYLEASARLLDGDTDDVEAYLRAVTPLHTEARRATQDRVLLNHKRLEEASHAVVITARRNAVLLGALATIGLIALVMLSQGLRSRVLDRLEALQDYARAIEEGSDERRIALDGHDELARLGAGMNRMLDRREELDHRLTGRLARQNELLLGLLGHWGAGTLLLGAAGEPIAALAHDATSTLDALGEAARGFRDARDGEAERTVTADGREFRIQRLDRDGRTVGWLVTPLDAPAPPPAQRPE